MESAEERQIGVGVQGLLGLDLGGTSIRAVWCDAEGRALGQAKAAGGNLRSSVGDPATNVATAVRGAVGEAPPAGDWSVVVGAAGAAEARADEVVDLVRRGLAAAGVVAEPAVVPDTDIAYRSVADDPDGVLLLAGTGAIAVRFEGWVGQQRCDGLGWLLGDAGSGLWLGWQALRAVAADLDLRGARTSLTAPVLERLEVATKDPRQGLIRAVDDMRAAQFAALVPLVFEHAADPVIAALLDQCADQLARTVETVATGPVAPVLAGGLVAGGPVRARLERRFGPLRHADLPVVGACALAAARAGIELDRVRLSGELRSMI